jgi:hypothetical protein
MRARTINEKTANIFIRCAYIAAIIGGLFTLLIIFTRQYGFSLFNLLDVIVFWGLAFGVYRKSRICAILLLVYNIANRADMWVRTRDFMTAIGDPVTLAFLTFYILGVVGTFTYHRILKEKHAAASMPDDRQAI